MGNWIPDMWNIRRASEDRNGLNFRTANEHFATSVGSEGGWHHEYLSDGKVRRVHKPKTYELGDTCSCGHPNALADSKLQELRKQHEELNTDKTHDALLGHMNELMDKQKSLAEFHKKMDVSHMNDDERHMHEYETYNHRANAANIKERIKTYGVQDYMISKNSSNNMWNIRRASEDRNGLNKDELHPALDPLPRWPDEMYKPQASKSKDIDLNFNAGEMPDLSDIAGRADQYKKDFADIAAKHEELTNRFQTNHQQMRVSIDNKNNTADLMETMKQLSENNEASLSDNLAKINELKDILNKKSSRTAHLDGAREGDDCACGQNRKINRLVEGLHDAMEDHRNYNTPNTRQQVKDHINSLISVHNHALDNHHPDDRAAIIHNNNIKVLRQQGKSL